MSERIVVVVVVGRHRTNERTNVANIEHRTSNVEHRLFLHSLLLLFRPSAVPSVVPSFLHLFVCLLDCSFDRSFVRWSLSSSSLEVAFEVA